MPEATVHLSSAPSASEKWLDRQLLAGLLLAPLAAGINTVVGYTVAHWVCNVQHKTTGFIVSGVDFALCLLSAFLAWTARKRLPQADDSQPEQGRRRFMAAMALAFAAFAAVVVFAGTLVMVTLDPCD